MMWANRNGFFYVLDRETGRFLSGTPFVKVNWASGFDEKGRPIQTPPAPGYSRLSRKPGWNELVFAVLQPAHGTLLRICLAKLFLDFQARGRQLRTRTPLCRRRQSDGNAVTDAPGIGIGRRKPINNWTDAVGNGAVVAIDPRTGQHKWEFKQYDVSDSGILTTASDFSSQGPRRVFPCTRRSHRCAALEDQPRRANREWSDNLSGRWEAVRVRHLRQCSGDVRPARIIHASRNKSWRCLHGA